MTIFWKIYEKGTFQWKFHKNQMKNKVAEVFDKQIAIWATARQNQQNDLCAQQRFRSAWAFTQSDQSSLCALWVAKDSVFLHVDSKDTDQTGWMPRLICLRWAHFSFCRFCHAVAHLWDHCWQTKIQRTSVSLMHLSAINTILHCV